MKRLHLCAALPSLKAVGASSSTQTPSSTPYTALAEQKCGLRNLHQYPKARHKSLVKDTRRFSRNWWLTAGNNYELVDEKGHELEATENFGIYRDDAENDRYVVYTDKLSDLPASQRLKALVALMEKRWRVRDSGRGFDRAKMLLQALECFSEMHLTGEMPDFDALPESDQDTFLQYAEGCAQLCHACAHSHPDAVAVLIRATQICDEIRCTEKRDELLHMAETTTRRMDRTYAFARPPRERVHVSDPLLDLYSNSARRKQREQLRQRFKDRPHVLREETNEVGRIPGARGKTHTLVAMKPNDHRRRILEEPHRPEESSWHE